MEDDVGGLEEAEGFDGEQIGIAGAGADEIDVAGGSKRRSFDSLRCASVAQDDSLLLRCGFTELSELS